MTEESFISAAPQPQSEVISATDLDTHSVISYLKRPRVVAQFDWSTTDKVDKILWTAQIPDLLLDTMNLQKLDGFGTFSATTVLTFQINSQPFQQGLLLLQSRPSDRILGTRGEWCDQNCANAMLLPSRIFDISTTTEVQIRIPYNSPLQEYNLISGQWPWATFNVFVLTPFNVISTSSIKITVFGHYENIHLGAPTTMPVKAVAQVGKEALGPVSAITKQISGVTSYLSSAASSHLPGLSGILDKGTTISDAVTSILSALGWSKPLSAIPPQPVLQRPTQYTGTADGTDSGLPLSLVHNNKITFKENFGGSEADECSLDYILKLPNLIYRGVYGINNKPGDVLFKTMLCPSWYVTTTANKPFQKYATNITYWASTCKYWRGGFKFTIRFARCNYVSGRLQVVYSPYSDNTSTTMVSRAAYAYKIILDLREQTEFTFLVPYIATTHYKEFPNNDSSDDTVRDWDSLDNATSDPNHKYSVGTLTLQVLTPLQANQTILTPSIDFIVDVAAADDFEIAVPTDNLCVPVYGYKALPTAQSGSIGATGIRDTRESYVSKSFIPTDITGKPLTKPTPLPAEQCIGERFASVREIAKRFSWHQIWPSFRMVYVSTLPILSQNADNNFDLRTDDDNAKANANVSYYNYVANCFAYRRGGFYIKSASVKDTKSVSLAEYSLTGANLSPRVYEQSSKPLHELYVPFYARTTHVPVNFKADSYQIIPHEVVNSSTGNRLWGFAGADDTDFGYYIGPCRHYLKFALSGLDNPDAADASKIV